MLCCGEIEEYGKYRRALYQGVREHGNGQSCEVSDNSQKPIICGWHFPVPEHALIIGLATVKCTLLLIAN